MYMTDEEMAIMEKDIVIHEEMAGKIVTVLDYPSWHLGVAQTFKDILKEAKKKPIEYGKEK